MKESWEKPEVSFQHLLHLQKDLHAWNPGCSSKLDQQVCVRKGYSPTVPNSLSLFPFTSRAVERYYCVCQRLLLTMQTLGCSPFLNAQDLFFFCQRIPFLKYNFLIQDRGWKILWEGGSSLIFLFLPIIQICIIYCMLYLDCRTTCWFQWSLAEVIWEPQKYRWLFFFSFFFFPAALSAVNECNSHGHTSKQPGSTRDVWAPSGLWSCPQLSSGPLTSSCLPAPGHGTVQLLAPLIIQHCSQCRTCGQDGKMSVPHSIWQMSSSW